MWRSKLVLARATRLSLDETTVRPFLVQNLLPKIEGGRRLQEQLAHRWAVDQNVPIVDEANNVRFLRVMGKFSSGTYGVIDERALATMRHALFPLVGDVSTRHGMRKLLEAVGFVAPGDNIHRMLFEQALELPMEAKLHAEKHLKPNDPYDELRSETTSNIYAIDSATTSEVDDAVGIEIDTNGVQWITVYVSDATAYVPFDSDLEVLTGRAVGTTVYLPEMVAFMLPREVIEAATLRENDQCRTFNIKFRVEADGRLSDPAISVGFTRHLKRLTYMQVQNLLATGSKKPLPDSPSWMKDDDVEKVHALFRIANRLPGGQSTNVPEPYIKVESKKVVELKDQILCEVDARYLVAQLMIAANSVCSRMAQGAGVAIPFRGSRPLSALHEAASEFYLPAGAETQCGTVDSAAGKLADGIMHAIANLRGVTRAMYYHEPLYHNGLKTSDYCHSTSPLRRYADMLVHHQLKCIIAKQNERQFYHLIDESQVAELCLLTTRNAIHADLTQDRSVRFWTLKFLEAQPAPRFITCLAGHTWRIDGCPDEVREMSRAHKFRTDAFAVDLQTTVTLFHSFDVVPGSSMRCRVTKLDPECDDFELEVVNVGPAEASLDLFAKAASLGSGA